MASINPHPSHATAKPPPAYHHTSTPHRALMSGGIIPSSTSGSAPQPRVPHSPVFSSYLLHHRGDAVRAVRSAVNPDKTKKLSSMCVLNCNILMISNCLYLLCATTHGKSSSGVPDSTHYILDYLWIPSRWFIALRQFVVSFSSSLKPLFAGF